MAISPWSTTPSDPATFSANRAGQLTDRQRQILKPPEVLGTQILVGASLCVIAAGGYFFLIFPLSGMLHNTGASLTSLASPSF